jgi:pimeloyl-ACP methyl ester carboxylesterase
VSGKQLHYVRRGSGPALLLIHGLGGNLGIWNPVMDRLATERDVIAADLPGFGGSPMLDGATGQAPGKMAVALAELCGELGVGRPHAAGNSLGAWVALEMAKQGSVASVGAISPAGLWPHVLGPRSHNVHDIGNRLRPAINALLRTRRGRSIVLRSSVARPELVPRADAMELVGAYLDSPGYSAANDAMRSAVFEDEGRIDVPVTIAWGTLDRLVSRPSRRRIPPGARLLEMPGWGHTPTWDDPEGVADFLLEASTARAATETPDDDSVRR